MFNALYIGELAQLARRLNPKPFGLGFKSPRKQKQIVWEVHCSGDTVAHLTPLTPRWPGDILRKIADFSPKSPIYRDKSPISRDLSRKIIWPIFLQEKSCRSPSTHDISAIYRRKSATFSSLGSTPGRRDTHFDNYTNYGGRSNNKNNWPHNWFLTPLWVVSPFSTNVLPHLLA